MNHTLPTNIDDNNVNVKIYDVKTNQLVDEYDFHNRLVIRYHLVLTHLLSPVGNSALQNQMSPADFVKFGIPTDADLKITKMKFGTNGSPTNIYQSGLINIVEPGFNANGTTIPPGTKDYYDIDTYKFLNGVEIGGIPDYDQAINFEITMAGPQGNSITNEPVVYQEAGLFTNNGIMFARTNLPSLRKDQNFAFKLSWIIRIP
jgi:hypothetical protein